jgi:hypothetical protein
MAASKPSTTIRLRRPANRGQGWFVVRTKSSGTVKGTSEIRVGLKQVLRARREQRRFFTRRRS